MAAGAALSKSLTNHDPLHLIAMNDDPSTEDVTRVPTVAQVQLQRIVSGEKHDRSYTTDGLRVYIDETNGSDSNGFGTRQEPYQSVQGALRARPQSNIELYAKKRFVSDTEKFDPVLIPPGAIPVSVGGFVTEYWYPLDVHPSVRDSIEEEKRSKYDPPPYPSSALDEKAGSGFFGKLKKAMA